MSISIYHEQQESLLCGQHCLNNLLQGPFFTAIQLGEIANDLDEQERQILGSSDSLSSSANVDDSGNFSIQVLKCALKRYNNVDLDPWFHQSGLVDLDPLDQKGFIVNRSDHWFSIRKIKSNWWDLNSTKERPELISQFYLSAFLHQLRADGYSVFIAKGNLTDHGDPALLDSYLQQGSGKWYLEANLLSKSGDLQNGKIPGATFSGVGRKLGSDKQQHLIDHSAFHVMGCEQDEDLLLAEAISASMESTIPNTVSKKPLSQAEEMRAKRLAALDKRGI